MFSEMRAQRLADIDRHLANVEQRIERLSRAASRASADAPHVAEHVRDTIAAALGTIADRFQGYSKSARRDTAELGDDLAKFGNQALRTLAREENRQPLIMIAVAVGVGLLAAGLLARRS